MKKYPFCFLSRFFFFLFALSASQSSFVFIIGGTLRQDTIRNNGVQQPVYTTTRLLTSRPVIDGKLDDDCWKNGTWAGNYTQFIPREGAMPTYPTEMNIQYDDRYLYVAFRAYDSEPDKINRYAGVRDELIGDMVGINFDSYRDYRTGFEFTITAWGQKVDLILFNPNNWDVNWEAVWKGKTGLEDSAWVAELEIPFSQLRYSKQDEQVWGLHTWRWISRFQEESNWEKQTKTGPGIMYNFGELRGIEGLKKSRRLELLPYALGEVSTMEKEPGNPFTENGREFGGNAGLDAKVGISSNFTLDLTVNPDFGQVESDPSVMNLTAFETFYEEKRPFFLEGLTIFDYKFDNQSLFYSRRIGHAPSKETEPDDSLYVSSPRMTTIVSAAKLSGTTSKGLSVGFIQSITGPEYAELIDTEGNSSTSKIEPLTSYTIARLQKGYKAGTTVLGGMLTSTNRFIDDPGLDFLTGNAVTGGIDLLHRWRDKEFFIDARLIGSYVDGSNESITRLQESSARYYQRPDADYLDYDTSRTYIGGYGGKFIIGKGAKGFWRYSTGATWLSPGLELNDLGYMRMVDEINQENEISYFVNQPVSIFRTYTITLEQFNSWNFGGRYLGSGGHLAFNSEFINQWVLSANLIFHSGAYDTRILRGGYDMMVPYSIMSFGFLKTDQSKRAAAGIEYEYQYSGENSASSLRIQPEIKLRPFRVLNFILSASYEKNYNDIQYVDEVDYVPENRYILGTIRQETFGLTFRANLNITPEFSIQYYGSPFVSRGAYDEFKRVTDPAAKHYSDRFMIFNDPVYNGSGYLLDENDDNIPDYAIADPDFNFHQFRSNLVAKWEYRLGSFIYFVWSGERTGFAEPANSSLAESFDQLRKVFPKNIFLVKLNYWFSL